MIYNDKISNFEELLNKDNSQSYTCTSHGNVQSY